MADPVGDHSLSDPVCPSAMEETERLLVSALSGEGGSSDASSLSSLSEVLAGNDDRLAFLDALQLAGVISESSSCSLRPDGTFDCG